MKKLILTIIALWSFSACDNPYDLVEADKTYNGKPFVSLNAEQGVVYLSVNEDKNNTDRPGVLKDSLLINRPLDHDLTVTLEAVPSETRGTVGKNFRFDVQAVIKAGKSYGYYTVQVLDLPEDQISQNKLSLCIKSVDDTDVIAGLYGLKKKNEERKKHFKTYSFKK
ncbi:MAG: hypothetical protein MI739_11455 [Bacteroidales bacterium]|nr:hypothetical protein [Bacteroidales bacterium]